MSTTQQAGGPADTTGGEEFAARMTAVLNDACTALMLSIGHQTRLLEALAASTAFVSSQELADRAGLHERYVREWLGAMTTARIVEHDPTGGGYLLPPEHARWLVPAAGPDNFARMMQYIAELAAVEQPIVECFRTGGGLGYDRYPRFHELMAEDSGAVFDAALLDTILPLVPGLVDRLRDGIDVADLGCGSGHAVNLMARAFPRSRFTGYDFSAEAIARAHDEAERLRLSNAAFAVQDVAEMGDAAAYDLVTAFDAVHDQAHPAEVLRRARQALRPGGCFLMVDIRCSSTLAENLEAPFGPFVYTVSTLHCMPVSLGQGGAGLGTAWGRQRAEAMLREAGFATVEVSDVADDPFNYYYVARP